MSAPATVAGRLAEWIAGLANEDLPSSASRACADTVIDTFGLAISARDADYAIALRESWPDAGPCLVLGSGERRSAPAAAMINGTAAHGEDFDNTFEGCPVHWGAVIVPAVMAAAQAHGRGCAQALRGLAVGGEVMCRLGLVAQKGVHAAGFHPTAVLGAMGAAAAVATTLELPAHQTVHALGIAGSMASGIIEYLADGSWTKRMHAGWAAQSGVRAALMAKSGFTGPASVFEGRHGLMHGFAPSVEADFALLTENLGALWHVERTAFKPYACGTMTQPFVDCAIRLARRTDADRIAALICRVGEGTVHRLWEPLDSKQHPPNAYAAKFSTPYCIAVGFVRGDAGLAEFTEAVVTDPAVLSLAERVSYEIDPADEYPRNYTGHISAVLEDGRALEEFQPHLRGGSREPLTREQLVAKCAANVAYGGAAPEHVAAIESLAEALERSDRTARIDALLAPLTG